MWPASQSASATVSPSTSNPRSASRSSDRLAMSASAFCRLHQTLRQPLPIDPFPALRGLGQDVQGNKQPVGRQRPQLAASSNESIDDVAIFLHHRISQMRGDYSLQLFALGFLQLQ